MAGDRSRILSIFIGQARQIKLPEWQKLPSNPSMGVSTAAVYVCITALI